MRFFRGFIALLLLACGFGAIGQTKETEKQPRILILLDASSSMGSDWNAGENRFKVASRIITTLMDSLYKVNKDVEFGLRVYGHQSPAQNNNCFDTRLEVMFSKDNIAQMYLRLASLHAIGVSPIAFSLKEAAEYDLTDLDRNTYSLILITDGEESCGGNICDVVKELLEKKIDFKPYILGLVDNTALKSQYACVGNYLSVIKENDIKPTVGKIVEAYRPMLTMNTVQRKIIESTVIHAPSVLNVPIPKVEVKKETVVTEQVPIQAPPPPAPKPTIDRPETKIPVVKLATPAIDLTDRTNEITPDIAKDYPPILKPVTSNRTFSVVYPGPTFYKLDLPPYNPPPLKAEPVLVAKAPVAPPPAPKPVEKPVVVPTPPVAPPAPKPVVKKPEPTPIEPVELTKPKELKYTQKTEESKETTLQVYFTDGRGTYYQTNPQLVLLDPKTKQPIQKFYRTVNAAGTPDPQKVAAGNYSLTITGKANYIVPDIKVEANKNTAIIIPVSEGSIFFGYAKNPQRPVEYVATVYHRFSSSPVVKQKCTQELFYEPGTYHVEINTLPPFKRTFDLNFGEQYLVQLPNEGELVITNTNNIGKVTLFYPFGDQFRIFYNMNVEGSGEGQKLTLLPGSYKASFKGPNNEQTVVQFLITSDNVTNLELK